MHCRLISTRRRVKEIWKWNNKNVPKVSLRNYDKRACDSPRLRFVQRSGIIFLTRRHRKLGRTRVVDTAPLSACGISNRNRSVSKFANYVWPAFTHANPFTNPYHESIAKSIVDRTIPPTLTLDRACILYWEAKQLGDRVGFATKFDGVDGFERGK